MSAWDTIVGIDLDLWMRAENNPVQIAWLAHLREHPLPEQGLPFPVPDFPEDCTCDRVLVPSLGTSFVSVIPGWRDPACPAHRRR